MADSIALPAGLLTKQQYEKAQFDQKYNMEKDLGRDAFLKLFTTQLQNQNPLDPMDNEAFVSQLAQFSSLESMKAMQSSIEQMSASFQGEKFISSSNLLGRYLRNESAAVMTGKGQDSRAVADLSNGAEEVKIGVIDSMGNKFTARLWARSCREKCKLPGMGKTTRARHYRTASINLLWRPRLTTSSCQFLSAPRIASSQCAGTVPAMTTPLRLRPAVSLIPNK